MNTLDQATAQRIVDRAMPVIGHSVNVMTPEGIIIASGDSRRVGEMHEGARTVAKTGTPLVVDEAQAGEYPGVRPGVNLPVVMSGSVVAVVGISGTPDKVLPYADLLRITAELILEQAALIEVTRHRRNQIQNTLQALLDGELVPEDWPQQIGLDIHKPRIAVVLAANKATSPWPPDMATLSRDLERTEPEALVLLTRQRHLAFFFTERPAAEALNAALGRIPATSRNSVSAATGTVFHSNLKACYESAEAALKAGKQRQPSGGHFSFQDFPLATLWQSLSPGWQQLQLNQAIRPLLAHPRREQYLKTLRTFIEADGDIQRCASQLHLHRNSVRYRLKGIETLTGWSPFRLEDLLFLYMAMENR